MTQHTYNPADWLASLGTDMVSYVLDRLPVATNAQFHVAIKNGVAQWTHVQAPEWPDHDNPRQQMQLFKP